MINTLTNNNFTTQIANIEKIVTQIKQKISAVRGTLTFISPDSETVIKKKELEFQKELEQLYLQKQTINLEAKLQTNKITQQEYDQSLESLNNEYNDKISQIDSEISSLNQNIQQQKSENEKLKLKKQSLSQELNQQKIEVKKSQTQADQLRIKNTVKNVGPKTIVIALAYLVNSQVTRLSKEVSSLELLVDETNNIIDNIQTQQDIQNAQNHRNNALLLLNNSQRKISSIKKFIDLIDKILKVMLIILNVLQRIAQIAPLPAIRAIASATVAKLLPVVLGLSVVISTMNRSLETLLTRLADAKARLKQIGNILDQDPNSILAGKTNLSNNLLQLGLVNGVEYNGFRFVIKEENNSKFVVQGYKRHYAVAINKDGNEVVKSEYSFTLDPNVLISELELVIDQQNLTA